ncbi:MAG TPA: Uma2 family endonuclease [Thermoanaerobaculia bacterium]|jgi:Uma2 family endonuclease
MAQPAPRPQVLPEQEDGPWPAPGKWTYADYRRLPDDGKRYEVIRGYLYVSPTPPTSHQRALGRLLLKLDDFVLDHGSGEILLGPIDILLPEGIAEPVQPDLVFIRAGEEPGKWAQNFQGVPDLVVEVLSPDTRQYDLGTKLDAYLEAGVPEVWFADPSTATIWIHGLSEDRKRYLELSRGGRGESVTSRALPGLRIAVSEIFPR